MLIGDWEIIQQLETVSGESGRRSELTKHNGIVEQIVEGSCGLIETIQEI